MLLAGHLIFSAVLSVLIMIIGCSEGISSSKEILLEVQELPHQGKKGLTASNKLVFLVHQLLNGVEKNSKKPQEVTLAQYLKSLINKEENKDIGNKGRNLLVIVKENEKKGNMITRRIGSPPIGQLTDGTPTKEIVLKSAAQDKKLKKSSKNDSSSEDDSGGSSEYIKDNTEEKSKENSKSYSKDNSKEKSKVHSKEKSKVHSKDSSKNVHKTQPKEVSQEAIKKNAKTALKMGKNGKKEASDEDVDKKEIARSKLDSLRRTKKRWNAKCDKKAAKVCIAACKQAMKNVCRTFKCKGKMKKRAKKECKSTCKDKFQVGGGGGGSGKKGCND